MSSSGLQTVLEVRGVAKHFGRVVALREANFELRDGEVHAIETVYQDLALADHPDASANLFLGREELLPPPLSWFGFLDKKAMRRRAEDEIRRLKIGIASVEQPVLNLSGGQRQAVAVARAIAWGRRI